MGGLQEKRKQGEGVLEKVKEEGGKERVLLGRFEVEKAGFVRGQNAKLEQTLQGEPQTEEH